MLGAFLSVVGLLMVAYFSLFFSAAVPADNGVMPAQQVNNFGLLVDRLIGVVVGGGLLISGAVLVAAAEIVEQLPGQMNDNIQRLIRANNQSQSTPGEAEYKGFRS